jgi:hypothetical protein
MGRLDGSPDALSDLSAKLPVQRLAAAFRSETGAWDALGDVRPDAAVVDSWERRVADAGRLAGLARDVPAPDAPWPLRALRLAQRAWEASTAPYTRAVARSGARSYEGLEPAAALALSPSAVEPQWLAAEPEELAVAAISPTAESTLLAQPGPRKSELQVWGQPEPLMLAEQPAEPEAEEPGP